ncbi:MAG: alanine racemase [Lachnospiraceae bacterium]|nr:alanine racemase [Lachnospiraceae bacterium]
MEWYKEAAGLPTPYYMYDFDRARSDIRRMREIVGEKIGLCFAMKANPFLVPEVFAAVDRIEICSMGEYRICRKIGQPAEKMYISGVLKEPADIREILQDTQGKSRYTAESPAQYRLIADWAMDNKVPVRIYPRLTSGNQFGMDEETVAEILKQAADHPYVTVEGLHFFSGTQKRNAGQIRKELQQLDVFLQEHTGIPELEYGPGLTVNYFTPDSWEKSQEMLAETADEAGKMTYPGHITFEMGRGIAANCGYYVTQVRDTKQSRGNNICIVDGGIHQINYDGQMLGMKHPTVSLNGEAPGETEWDVYGSLCTVHDVLLKRYPLGELNVGDRLVFHQTGAYSAMEGIALLLSHELPALYGWDAEKGIRQLRERKETWEWNC